jgi:hypothetical protein
MMKVDPVVNNMDEMLMANMTQLNKLKYLEAEKAKWEGYIRDLQQTMELNK